MNSFPTPDHPSSENGPQFKHLSVWLGIMALMVATLAVSDQSLWIDEVATANYARNSSIREFTRMLLDDNQSATQMPLGMFQAYCFEKILGHSEYALRLPNILWLALGIAAFASLGKRHNMPWLPVLIGVHPMAWYYIDEVRPYAMQIGLSATLLWFCLHLVSDARVSRRTTVAGCLAAILLCGSSLLAAILFALLCAVTFVFTRHRWRCVRRDHALIAGVTVVVLAALAAYYASTLARGAGGARIWSIGLTNLGFSLFELGGYFGFSPGRLPLRYAAREGLGQVLQIMKPYALPIVLLVAIQGLAIAGLVKRLRSKPCKPVAVLPLAFVVSAFVLIYGLCEVMGFPFWGRHFAPVLPWMIWLLAVAVSGWKSRMRSFLLALLVTAWLGGSLYQRFTPSHRKDDYRAAAKLAVDAESEGRSVLWVACVIAAEYYGYDARLSYLDVESDPAGPWKRADMVFYSKPDIYDSKGLVRECINSNRLTTIAELPAFRVWARVASP